MKLLKFKGVDNDGAVPVGKINNIEKMNRDDPGNFDGDGGSYGCLINTEKTIIYCRDNYEDIIASLEEDV